MPSGASVKTVCVQWPRLGPYHLARLRAAHERLAREGVRLVALETAGQDETYAWRQERGATSYERVQVFEGGVFEELPPRAIFEGVTAALERIEPDAVVINSYSAPDAQAALVWCRRRRRTAVVLMESKADDAARSGLREWIKASIVRQFDAALAGGSPQVAYLDRLGFPTEYAFLTCDAVDNDFFRQGAEAARANPDAVRHLPGLADETPYFLASNRFVARKNLGVLLRAYGTYRRTAERCPAEGCPAAVPWRLLMLGDGPLRADLEALVARENIGGVTFCGFRQIEELPAYYGLAGAFVHAALVEQWGLVVNEAMAAGLPVLVSERVGSAYDLVLEGETGFRFDPERPEDLARMMARLAAPGPDQADARAAMGERAQAVVAGWAPEQFGEGLWQAVQAGRSRANRPFSATVRFLLWAMRTLSREVKSFHAIKE